MCRNPGKHSTLGCNKNPYQNVQMLGFRCFLVSLSGDQVGQVGQSGQPVIELAPLAPLVPHLTQLPHLLAYVFMKEGKQVRPSRGSGAQVGQLANCGQFNHHQVGQVGQSRLVVSPQRSQCDVRLCGCECIPDTPWFQLQVYM